MATQKLSPEAFPAKAKPKRAALYCRVSTGDQHLETQLWSAIAPPLPIFCGAGVYWRRAAKIEFQTARIQGGQDE
jgi:hypothetical protein